MTEVKIMFGRVSGGGRWWIEVTVGGESKSCSLGVVWLPECYGGTSSPP